MTNHQAVHVGVIGHRDLDENGERLFVQTFFHQVLRELTSQIPPLTAVSALASGADTVFAECAHRLGIPLVSVIPFSGFERDFPDPEAFARYQALRAKSGLEWRLHFSQRTGSAYRKSMEWVIMKSDLVMAAWDGQCVGSVGGTWEALSLCERLGKPILHIHTKKRTLSFRAGGISKSGSPEQLLNDFIRRHLP